MRDYAEKVKVKLDVVSLERIATVRRVEFVGGSKTYITGKIYSINAVFFLKTHIFCNIKNFSLSFQRFR